VECDPQTPLAIGDDQRLQQVMLNLVVNAEYAVHRAERRILTLRTGRRMTGGTPQVFIEIDDTGSGMTPEVLSHIFEPFFTTKPAGVGTGLGLSVSHTIVQAHGGTIDVRSTPGTGSTFTVALPAYVAGADSRAEPAGSRRRSRPIDNTTLQTVSPASPALGPAAAASLHVESAAAPRPRSPSSVSTPHAD
jgi:K+-sensing histidine kinase KdpD